MAQKNKIKFSWVYKEKKEKKKIPNFLMWKQNPPFPLSKNRKKKPLLRTGVFFFSPPQFCDVAQVVIDHP